MTDIKELLPGRLPELLFRTAERFPEQGIGFIRPDRSVNYCLYPELLEKSERILGGLQQEGLAEGDKAILSLDSSEEIIPVLWACFLGGIVPALLQPPVTFSEFNQAAEKAEKVFRLLENARVILSHAHYNNWLSGGIQPHSLIDIAKVPLETKGIPAQRKDPSDLALLQFSSGSTGDPKGVMLSHQNIIVNIHDISRGLKLMPHDVSVSWMPLFHDMGLMGFHMTALYIGNHQYFIEPADFIKNPALWLDSMSELKASITGCPNFGQVLVNRAVSRKRNSAWNFTPLRAVFNGAEPISVNTMREFNANLAPFGYDPVAMLPAYGMAEATLAVTFSPLEFPAEVRSFDRHELFANGRAVETDDAGTDPVSLVNLGKSLPHTSVIVADELGKALPEGCTGHILVSGGNITSGYYNHPAETAAVLKNGWLHTGDLGFMVRGDLFIMGRLKDIIFINGINYYSHDLETMSLQVEGTSYGRIVMAGYFDESEGKDKVIVFLVSPDNEAGRELFRNIRHFFQVRIGLLLDTFVPVRSNDIPRTSSGKIQRYKMVNRFLKGEFQVVRL